ncbi:hypothetical protein GWI33_005185 [Rhynchophorus ferrugineus]|uniref:Uncharacterized protein n=1 Tax=Rhynchophorus ferrugineus TaxID=354439 RepID=A0A834IJN9_RHYFE|nr:hypothetical protein GWI33_005185 [Rhynchophorus ferrugineus]
MVFWRTGEGRGTKGANVGPLSERDGGEGGIRGGGGGGVKKRPRPKTASFEDRFRKRNKKRRLRITFRTCSDSFNVLGYGVSIRSRIMYFATLK